MDGYNQSGLPVYVPTLSLPRVAGIIGEVAKDAEQLCVKDNGAESRGDRVAIEFYRGVNVVARVGMLVAATGEVEEFEKFVSGLISLAAKYLPPIACVELGEDAGYLEDRVLRFRSSNARARELNELFAQQSSQQYEDVIRSIKEKLGRKP